MIGLPCRACSCRKFVILSPSIFSSSYSSSSQVNNSTDRERMLSNCISRDVPLEPLSLSCSLSLLGPSHHRFPAKGSFFISFVFLRLTPLSLSITVSETEVQPQHHSLFVKKENRLRIWLFAYAIASYARHF